MMVFFKPLPDTSTDESNDSLVQSYDSAFAALEKPAFQHYAKYYPQGTALQLAAIFI